MCPTWNKMKYLHSGLPNSLSSSDHFLHSQINAFHNPRSHLFQAVCTKFRKTNSALWMRVSRGKVKTSVTFEIQLLIHLRLLHVFQLQLVSCVFSLNTGAGKKQHQRTSCKYLWNSYKLAKLISRKTSYHAASRGRWQDYFCILSCCFQTEFLVHPPSGIVCKYW